MELKEILKQQNFSFSKRYGQNFISDVNLLEAIVRDAGVGDEDTVIEIGAGGGTLSRAIASKAKELIAFEIDERLRPVLQETLKDFANVTLIFGDFMKEGGKILGKMENFSVVANIPYYITTPIIMECLEEYHARSLTFMVQKEVAERFIASPATKEYGAITASANLYADASITRIVKREMFYPMPEVDSAVLRFIPHQRFLKDDKKNAQALIKQAFTMRRKTLVNNLVGFRAHSKEKASEKIKACGIDPTARAETLSAEQFVCLAKTFFEN